MKDFYEKEKIWFLIYKDTTTVTNKEYMCYLQYIESEREREGRGENNITNKYRKRGEADLGEKKKKVTVLKDTEKNYCSEGEREKNVIVVKEKEKKVIVDKEREKKSFCSQEES